MVQQQAVTKEIVQDYVLITFDIPQSNPKLRRQVLKRLHSLGAMMHTDSVYLCPFSEEVQALANDISAGGEVVVWRSRQDDEEKAKSLTFQYDKHVYERCQLIYMRLAQIKAHIEQGRLGIADKMIQKTVFLLNQVKSISKTYCPEWLPEAIAKLDLAIQQIHDEEGSK